MKKWTFIVSLMTIGMAGAQHTAGEWFINAGGKPSINLNFKNYSLHAQTGYFVTSRLAFGAEMQYNSWGSAFRQKSYSLFARYYFMNQDKFGLYGFTSFGRGEMKYLYGTNMYQKYFTTSLGLGTDIKLSDNWRLNLEVNILGGSSATPSGRLGLSYSIPYRKKGLKRGVL